MEESTVVRLLSEAVRAGETRDYRKSVELLTALLAEEDAPPEALLFLGRAYHALGEIGKSLLAFRAYLRSGGDTAAGAFFLGRSYLTAGRYGEASQSLRRSLEADPDRAPAWALLGAAQLKLRRTKVAVDCLERAVKLAPEDTRVFRGYLNALFVRSCRLLARGDADMARQMLTFAIDNGLDGAAPRLWRARACRELGRFGEALADCETAVAFSPDDGSLRWLRASLLLASGRGREALQEFEALRGRYPDLPGLPQDERSLGRLRASVAFREERWKEAAAESLALLRATPDDASLRAMAAESFRNLGQLEKSMNHWERAVEADPKAAEFRLGLAATLFELGDYEGARGQAERALRLGADPSEVEYYTVLSSVKAGGDAASLLPRLQALIRRRGADPHVMFALGECLFRTGRPDLAAGWFEKVLYLVPGHELSLLYRISIAESLGDADSLGPSYAAYLEAYPDNGKIRREYIDLLMGDRKWEEAAGVIEQDISYGDAGDRSRRLLALAWRNAGHFRDAAVIYRELLRASPENAEYLLALAWCLERDGKGDYALALLERAPAGAKRGAGPWIVLGLLYERRGLKEKAVDALRAATDREPGHPRAWKDLGLLYRRMGLAEFSAACLARARGLGAEVSEEELSAARPAAPAARKAKAPSSAPAAHSLKGELPKPGRSPLAGNDARQAESGNGARGPAHRGGQAARKNGKEKPEKRQA